jgi:hypothetical protein
MRTVTIIVAAAWLGLGLVACSDTSGSITGAEGLSSLKGGNVPANPLQMHQRAGAPALGATQVSFWAVQGSNSKARLQYQSAAGQEAETFLEFNINPKTQLVDPTGHPLAPGDSILITINAVPGDLAATFAPEGLVFSGKKLPELSISYAYGDVPVDPAIQLAVWYVPSDGGPLQQQPSVIDQSDQTVVADIHHFSNYAVAYRK